MGKRQSKKLGNEDFVRHKDILSSPVKAPSISPNKQLFLHKQKSRHSSPSKKNDLETLHTSPPKSDSLNLTQMLNEASSVNTSPVGVPLKRKRGRPTKEETLAKLKAQGLNPSRLPEQSSALPEGKRRKGRPRKEEVLARMKLKQEEDAKKLEIVMAQLPEGEEETAKIIKGDLLAENILPSRLPRRSALQIKRKLDFDDNSSDDESVASDADSSKEFNPDADKDSEDEDVVEESYIDNDDEVVKQSVKTLKEEKPKKKRGRPKKVKTDVPNLEPATPRKGDSREGSAPRDFNFVSPLKKTILDNLQQYKTNGKSTSLRLDKDFVPAPLPNANYKPRQTVTKANDFLDTFEGFFDQKKPIRSKGKSTNTMAMVPEITREEFALISNTFNKLFLKRKRDKLYELHYKMFPQYWFELTQGFTLLFYGVGSKREFLERFAIEYLSPKLKQIQLYLKDDQTSLSSNRKKGHTGIPCIVVNGYNPTCSYRDVFKDITNILFPEQLTSNETKYWGNHVSLQVAKMIQFYETQPHEIKLILVIHNIDGPSVRKDVFQTMLSSLAVIKQIAIVASADHVYTPVLWDNKKSQNYNFVFHDVTNYEPYSVESSFQDVMKMGKRETTTGAEGAKYVLESLTVNSKKLFKLLVESQISKMESDSNGKKVPPMKRPSLNTGLEFKHLAQRCAHDFIASNDISLRTMLREFIEHNMTNISRTGSGVEYVWVPYNYSELTKLKDTILANIE